jgi:NAD(P)-dependent dehydrogenase (short-subunit alcohol dehydrogenase family)
MILKDKVVIVTGASEGIGRAIAERLAKEGAKLALVARNEDRLKEAADNVDGEAFVCDIRDKAQIQQTVDAIVAKFGGIDVLVNNAGIWQRVSQLDELSDEMVGDVLATNLTGTIFMTKYVLPHLRSKNEETAIVQVVSRSGIVAQEGQSVYTASKYGVKGFTDVLRVDLKGTSIRIGAVYQSGTDTEMFRKTGEDFSQEKFTSPADLADAVVYMLTRPPKMWLPEIQVVY